MQQQQVDNLMDFKVLSKYDDLFTDIFLDNLFLWFTTIKMNHDHRRPRIKNEKILDIIQRNILTNAKPTDAVHELLAMDYFKHYLAVKNGRQVQEFIQHMKRYLYMYMPNAGYEIGDTRRYGGKNGNRVEACLIATKDWHIGDEMKLLTGMIACLDPKDDAELKRGNRDFSVMWSTRKNCSCLFLGPARFANHDCDSNCKFISSGQNTIMFKVVKDIEIGQEITVYYGKHYFGENNYECRCITCENTSMGYFAKESDQEEPMIKDEIIGSTRRSTRKRKSALHEEYSRKSIKIDTSSPSSPSATSLPHTYLQTKRDSIEDIILDTKPSISSPPSSVSSPTSRLKVMSIDYLCGNSDEEDVPVIKEERRVSLLDLLVDAVLLKETSDTKTVVVNPEIHRDAANRVLLQQQQKQQSVDETKADSAVSLSPTMNHWNDDLYKDEQDKLLDDFLDDVSDLSSISSDDTNDSSEEEEEEDTKPQLQQQRMKALKEELSCIACNKPLKKQDISEQVGGDMSITNELATWTWSPSAIFTDWRPKRCPRCERHVTLFKQEWPTRKIKKPKQKKQKKKKQPSKQETMITKVLQQQPTSAVEDDLNYCIPPSPLSEVAFDDSDSEFV